MKPAILIISALLLSACTKAEVPPAADTTAMTDSAPVAVATDSWTVSPRGIGQISAGMTLDEANAATGNALIVPPTLQECDWVRVKDAPKGLLLMVEGGKITRVNIDDSSTIATTNGAKVGDTEAQIELLFAGQVEVQPHKYTDGHYLVVTPVDPAEKDYRIVFETDGKKVLRYRSGLVPSVQYVEGCS
jgi:hypothetical protein